MNRRHLSLGTGLTLLVVAACDRAPEPSATTTVRDSGGVAIVEVAAMPSLPEWRVSEPVIAVGGVDDRPEYELYNAHHALLLSDGGVVIANRGTRELRFYDGSGQHVRSVGRRGGGPGEYENMWGLVHLPGDSIGVWDWTSKRLTLYDAEGALGRTVSAEFTRETEGPRSWTVHGADGIPAARLTMDRGMAPRDAEDAHLLAWSRDDLDVERITLHRIFTGDGS